MEINSNELKVASTPVSIIQIHVCIVSLGAILNFSCNTCNVWACTTHASNVQCIDIYAKGKMHRNNWYPVTHIETLLNVSRWYHLPYLIYRLQSQLKPRTN
jgi:hypothetical protein